MKTCERIEPEKLFPNLDAGGQRHVGRDVTPEGGWAVNFKLIPLAHAFGDHRDVQPGQEAHVVLTCAEKHPVAVVGTVGRGRVVRTGIALGLDGRAEEAEPEGEEKRFLLNAVRWLAQGDGWIDAEAARGRVRLSAARSIFFQPERLRVDVRAFVPVAMRPTTLRLSVKLVDPSGQSLRTRTVALTPKVGADVPASPQRLKPGEVFRPAATKRPICHSERSEESPARCPPGDSSLRYTPFRMTSFKIFGAES